MNNIILLLIAITIHQNFIVEQEESIHKIRNSVAMLDNKIKNEETILSNKKNILKNIDESLNTNEKNSKLFYTSNQKESVVYTLFQKEIESSLKKEKIKLLTSKWQEASINEVGLKKIAINIRIKSTSASFAKFYKLLHKKSKILFYDNLIVNKSRKKNEQHLILTSITLITYQTITSEA